MILENINKLYRSTLKKKTNLLQEAHRINTLLERKNGLNYATVLSYQHDLKEINRQLQNLEHYLNGIHDAREEVILEVFKKEEEWVER